MWRRGYRYVGLVAVCLACFERLLEHPCRGRVKTCCSDASRTAFSFDPPQTGSCTVNEQGAQIAIATFTDPEQGLAAAAASVRLLHCDGLHVKTRKFSGRTPVSEITRTPEMPSVAVSGRSRARLFNALVTDGHRQHQRRDLENIVSIVSDAESLP
jgi:hypothetical protein